MSHLLFTLCVLMGVAPVAGAVRLENTPQFLWGDKFLHHHELANVARGLTRDQVPRFREMIKAARPGATDWDVDDLIGGLLIDVPMMDREEFVRTFGVGDPVYGFPDEMEHQPLEMKMLLMRLSFKRVSPRDLRLVRARLAKVPPHRLNTLTELVRHMPAPIHIASLLERFAYLKSCDGKFGDDPP